MNFEIVPYDPDSHEADVVDLWKTVFGYDQARNNPRFSIARKIAAGDGLFFVARSKTDTPVLLGTVMGGYDGHRGWIYSLAVWPERQGQGIGTALAQHVEAALRVLGCPKINLQILGGNRAVESFYRSLGYQTEPRISMGKVIPENLPAES